MNTEDIIKQAEKELEEEEFRRLVELKKEVIRNRKKGLLSRLFPWKLTIILTKIGEDNE